VKVSAFTLLFILVIHTTHLFGQNSQSNDEDKSIVVSTSFFVSDDAEVAIPGDLDIKYSNTFENNGRFCFSNDLESQLILPPGDLGSGSFIFAGIKRMELNVLGEQARIGSLTMDMPKGTLDLFGDFAIPNYLELISGIIDVKRNSTLLIDNPSDESVSFNNSPINKSYVSGFLSRQLVAGGTYQFPVGDNTGFHPFLIDKPEKSDLVRVSFDKGVPEEFNNYNQIKSLNVENSLGWRIESDSRTRNNFLSGLSILNTSLADKTSQLEIYYLSDFDFSASVLACKSNLQKSTIGASYVYSSEPKSYGLYGFSKMLDVELVNFIYVGNDNKTNFEIPNFSDFSNLRLVVHNRLGSIIFKSDHYQNEFDARNYPNGTYFYELTLEKDNKNSIIRNFIDIKHEK